MDLDDITAELGDLAVFSHTTAATLRGYPVYGRRQPTVIVPRPWGSLRLPGVAVHRANLRDDEITCIGGRLVTSPLRTVTDCGRVLDLREAVAVADAALRLEHVDQGMAWLAARRLRGPGATTAIRALRLADGRAASGNESLARVSLIQAGLGPIDPQGMLDPGPWEHPVDLLLRWARTAIECESKEFHSSWPAVVKDISHHDKANREDFRLVRTYQAELWPFDTVFIRKVLDEVCKAPGRRAGRIRRQRELDERR